MCVRENETTFIASYRTMRVICSSGGRIGALLSADIEMKRIRLPGRLLKTLELSHSTTATTTTSTTTCTTTTCTTITYTTSTATNTSNPSTTTKSCIFIAIEMSCCLGAVVIILVLVYEVRRVDCVH